MKPDMLFGRDRIDAVQRFIAVSSLDALVAWIHPDAER
jgi:hypothetical protein